MRTSTIDILVTPLWRHKLGLGVAVFAAVVAQACGVALPLVAREAIHVTVRRGTPDAGGFLHGVNPILFYTGLVLFGLAIVRGVARWTQSYVGERISHQALAEIRLRMYRHTQRLSIGFFDRRPVGKIIIRFIGDANALRSWMARTLIAVPADILTVCLVVGAIVTIQPMMALATLGPLTALPLVMLFVNPLARRLTRVTRKNQTHLCGFLNDVLPNIRMVKAHGLEGEISDQVEEPIREVARAGIQRGGVDALLQASAMGLATASTATVVLTGLWLFHQGVMTSGDVLIVVWISLHIRGPVNRLSRANVIHQRAMVAVDRIAALLNREPERGWSEELASCAGPARTIELRRVGYRDIAKNQLLENYSTRFDGPGLYWLGTEGSTVIDILLRIRRPHRGRVLLDGVDVRTLRVSDIRSSLGLIVSPDWTAGQPFDVTALLLKRATNADAVARAWDETAELAPDALLSDLEAQCAEPVSAQTLGSRMAPQLRARIAFTLGLLNDPNILLIDDPFTGYPSEVVARISAWIRRAAEKRLVIVSARDRTAAKFPSQGDGASLGDATSRENRIGQSAARGACSPDDADSFLTPFGLDSERSFPKE